MSDLSDAVEVAKVAGQLLPQTMATVDSVVSSVVGVFELLMYPIKKANIEFKYKLEQFALDLQGKIEARKKGSSGIGVGRLMPPPELLALCLWTSERCCWATESVCWSRTA